MEIFFVECRLAYVCRYIKLTVSRCCDATEAVFSEFDIAISRYMCVACVSVLSGQHHQYQPIDLYPLLQVSQWFLYGFSDTVDHFAYIRKVPQKHRRTTSPVGNSVTIQCHWKCRIFRDCGRTIAEDVVQIKRSNILIVVGVFTYPMPNRGDRNARIGNRTHSRVTTINRFQCQCTHIHRRIDLEYMAIVSHA